MSHGKKNVQFRRITKDLFGQYDINWNEPIFTEYCFRLLLVKLIGEWNMYLLSE